ncbi:uncharacterized protein LOC114284149 [Camellia sinensis]|uniref:uncharacterized protein LOC114284149 n=1 Tax=Camellia sinensis TaxID=4442 RepID=UPI001035EA00|nr:uncharacterized protein LOC114284149 [Camellia sinensis]
MNRALTRPFCDEEIKLAAFQLAAFKARAQMVSLDFSIRIIGTKWGGLFALRLCNFILKIITKLLANRLKGILKNLISPNQSAFVSGRLIQDNVIVAHEAFHSLKLRKSRLVGQMAIKIDFDKAYDRIEWDFLAMVLRKMGFDSKWVHWVMECVSTVSFSIFANGEKKASFVPSRGLRQGDPLSPYLFIIVADVLSKLISHSLQNREIFGFKITRLCPTLTHLFFADDMLLFLKAEDTECQKILDLLKVYYEASGQRGRFKSAAFEFIIEKVISKLQGWKQKLLSQAGREILIEVVVQAIPSYAMLALSKFQGGLGFCDFQAFNSALLARQGWRLVKYPNSFCARILKGIYFPHTDFMHASKGRQPSWSWTSLLQGRQLLQQGIRWKINSGSNALFWEDCWIPGLPNFKIYSSKPIGTEVVTVEDVIDPIRKSWNLNLLCSQVSEPEVQAISSIPISLAPTEDSLIWHFEATRSVYCEVRLPCCHDGKLWVFQPHSIVFISGSELLLEANLEVEGSPENSSLLVAGMSKCACFKGEFVQTKVCFLLNVPTVSYDSENYGTYPFWL